MRIWGIPLLQFVLPCVLALTVLISGKALTFPFSTTGPALEFFPKLVSEYNTLEKEFSTEAANNYVVSYANSFALGSLLTICGLVIELIIRTQTSFRQQVAAVSAPRAESIGSAAQSQRHSALLSSVALLFVLLTFAFYIPISFTPSPGVSETRLVNSMYGAFIFAFPVIFTLIYFLSLAGLTSLYSNK